MKVSIIGLVLLIAAVAEQLQNPTPLTKLRTLTKAPSSDTPSEVHTLAASCTQSPLSGTQEGFTTDNGCSTNPDDAEPSGRVCTFTCVPGYQNNDDIVPFGTYQCNNGAWQVAQPGSCVPMQCEFPYYQPSLGYTFGQCRALLRVGSSCVLGCQSGYFARQGTDGVINCDVDMNGIVALSSPTLVCDAGPCATPPDLPNNNNGFSDCNDAGSIASGTTCTLACQPGYAASGSYTCTATRWSTVGTITPACTPATCTNPVLSDPLKSLGQCAQQTSTTSQSCEMGCITGYEPDVRAGTLITCSPNQDSTSSFSPYSYDCVDVDECLIAYPLACGVGWTCTNTIGAFNCSPQTPELDFNVDAKDFYRHYRASRQNDDDSDSEGEGRHARRDRDQDHSSTTHHRVGEGDGRGGAGGTDWDRVRRILKVRKQDLQDDINTHVFLGLKWALGAPTVVTQLELEVSEDVNAVTKLFNLPFENPQSKHVAFKALKGASYQFTLLVTTSTAPQQRSPPLLITVPAPTSP